MKRMFICGNWKMNKDRASAVALVQGLKPAAAAAPNVEVGVCPPFVYLLPVAEAVKGSRIALGAQNMYFEKEGAFTGEISAAMLLDCGAKYVILGHSERRHVLGESDEVINRKIKAAFAAGLTPIFCIGELLQERDGALTESVCERQVRKGLEGVSADLVRRIVVAYEPVWAIGTGRNATPDQANDVHRFTRKLLTSMYDKATADAVCIQYGGSVKPDNALELMKQSDVNGALVGGASLKPEVFAAVIAEAAKAIQ